MAFVILDNLIVLVMELCIKSILKHLLSVVRVKLYELKVIQQGAGISIGSA